MLELLRSRSFTNGTVYALKTKDGYPIETTDTFLPYYTKFCINNSNKLNSSEIGSRAERWMVGVSIASGCPVGCKFCATGQLPKYRPLKAQEILQQVAFVICKNAVSPTESQEFKINYTRMGEFGLNPFEVREAINAVNRWIPNAHHYVSTIGIRGTDFSWIEGNVTLQISLHSLDEKRRDELIPFANKMTVAELGKIRTRSNLKTTINLTLVDDEDWDIAKLKEYFDPEYFFVKISPINKNCISDSNGMGSGIIQVANIV